MKQWLPKKPKFIVSIIATLTVICGIFCILYAWQLPPFGLNLAKTNDAYIKSQTTLISSVLDGYAINVFVKDFDIVKQGEPLIQIDDRIFKENLKKAESQLKISQNKLENFDQVLAIKTDDVNAKDSAIQIKQADFNKFEADFIRISNLFKKNGASKKEFEQSKADYLRAKFDLEISKLDLDKAKYELQNYKNSEPILEAQVQIDKSLVELANIDLEHTLIKAPISGQIGEVGAKIGQFISKSSPLLYLIPDEKWAIANIKEIKMQNVKVGDKAVISVDALGGTTINGVVEEISPATGSEFSPIKVNNATGNFIKVIQRIPVRITLDKQDPNYKLLKSGMSIIASIRTDSLDRK